MSNFRVEQDSLGTLNVPKDALYGAQTQRAIDNFPISGQLMPTHFIRALLMAKKAAALANGQLNRIPVDMSKAITDAVDTLLSEDLMQHFPVDVFQTGSGTSTNMNANEVLASLASQYCQQEVHPNDHVNYGQSSNDIIPSTIHISAAITLTQNLLPALRHLISVTQDKVMQVEHHVKMGRTHLMDAMPITLGQSLQTWVEQIKQNIAQLEHLQPSIQSLAQGGTAVGTGINTDKQFITLFYQALSANTGITFTPANNFFTHISSQDIAVSLSGQLKATAVSMMKIANDLRWMNSGPMAGLGEIELEALQPGSSIMPGKVNPVIPEAAAMVAAQVIGNDTAITIAGQSGNFELNVMLPLIAKNLIESIELLSNTSTLLADKAIASFKVNTKILAQSVSKNPMLITALNPIIGYKKAADIAQLAYKQQRPIIDVATEQTELSREELEKLLDPIKLTLGGIQ
ncbi:class II fumarate hydratase [Thalassotalea sediminis]|uniref:class II fumarate hydratase n=1 Tax=Thalassotalea sediminis TaxID=1759089 RepID=UPI0025733C8A|nr:class II fumarate hydratase [Thalassotalea sediminis]